MKSLKVFLAFFMTSFFLHENALSQENNALFSKIREPFSKEYVLDKNFRFLSLEKDAGSGLFKFGASFNADTNFNIKVTPDQYSKTSINSISSVKMRAKMFGSSVEVFDVGFAMGNWKRIGTEPIPSDAKIFNIKWNTTVRLFGTKIKDEVIHNAGAKIKVGDISKVLFNKNIPITGPLSLNLIGGLYFSKSLSLDAELKSEKINYFSGSTDLISTSMSDFSSKIIKDSKAAVVKYTTSSASTVVQNKTWSSVGRVLDGYVNDKIRLTVAFGPEVSSGVFAKASAQLSVAVAGVEVGVAAKLNFLKAKVAAAISGTNVSQYFDVLLQGSTEILSGSLDAYAQAWVGFKTKFLGYTVDATIVIAKGVANIFSFGGYNFNHDILIARFKTRGGISFHWCLNDVSDPVCTMGYVIDPIPELLDYIDKSPDKYLYGSCPSNYFGFTLRGFDYDHVIKKLVCDYAGSVDSNSCNSAGGRSIDKQLKFGNLLKNDFKVFDLRCEQNAPDSDGAVLLSLLRTECPPLFLGRSFQSRLYDVTRQTTTCNYSGAVLLKDCNADAGFDPVSGNCDYFGSVGYNNNRLLRVPLISANGGSHYDAFDSSVKDEYQKLKNNFGP